MSRISDAKYFLLFLIIFFVAKADQQGQINHKLLSLKHSIQRIKLNIQNTQELLKSNFQFNQCNLPPTSNKFALLTVTKFRSTSQQNLQYGKKFFMEYLQKYAQMQCNMFDSIYFIWNNQKSPQEYGILQRKKYWKKNVIFLHTHQNSMDNRFIVPEWVDEQVFFSLDDDAIIDCQNFKKAFDQYIQRTISNLGPIGTLHGRVQTYNFDQDKFQYHTWTKSYISIGLPNTAIIPRHFMDLYYSNIHQFQKMREIVRQYSNCDDIALNFMANYMYSQFKTFQFKDIKGQLRSSQVQINKSPSHYDKRKQCLRIFTQYLGSNTNTMNVIGLNQEYQSKRTYPLKQLKCMLALKRSIIEKKYLTHKEYYLRLKAIYMYNVSESENLWNRIKKDNKILNLSIQKKQEMLNEKKSLASFSPKYSYEVLLNSQIFLNNTNKFEQKYYQAFMAKQEQQISELKSYLKIFQSIAIILSIFIIVGLFHIFYSKEKHLQEHSDLAHETTCKFEELQKLKI